MSNENTTLIPLLFTLLLLPEVSIQGTAAPIDDTLTRLDDR